MKRTKEINVITEFGVKPCKAIGKAAEIRGELWQVCEVPVCYMNSPEPLLLRKVVHYKTGGTLPLKGVRHNATAKDYISHAETFLSRIPDNAIKSELNSRETIN